MDGSSFKIEKFNGTNFAFWKMQIEDLLYQKKMYQPLSGIEKKPEAMSNEEWQILDRTALGIIRLSLTSSVAFNIANEKTTVDLMAALARMYEKPSASNKVFLMKQLFNMKMNDGGSVAGHLNAFNTLTRQLDSVGIVFDDEVRALLILSSLPESWSGLVTVVSNSSGNATLKFDDVVGLVLNEEVRRKPNGETSGSGVALHAGHGRKSDGRSDRIREKAKSKKGEVECWKCGQKGHFKRDCKNPRQGANQEETPSVNLNEVYPHDALLMSSQSVESYMI